MITVSNFLAYKDPIEQTSHWTTSTFGSSNSSTFLLNISKASPSTSNPTQNLEDVQDTDTSDTDKNVYKIS